MDEVIAVMRDEGLAVGDGHPCRYRKLVIRVSADGLPSS